MPIVTYNDSRNSKNNYIIHKLRCEWSTIDHNLALALLNFIAS